MGLAWDVMWLMVIAGALFVIVHAIFAKKTAPAGRAAVDPAVAAAVPEKVERHSRSARVSHWFLAAVTFTLLITAFVPIFGLQFPWLTIHWVAGILLAAYIVYHIIDTTVRMSWGEMWIGVREMGESIGRTRDFFRRTEDVDKRPGKWGTENKVFHHITALAGFGVVVSGILMMARVDTWFWESNPYIFGITDANWGWIFILHGITAVGFVGLLIAHIYLAVRPDNLWITRSMFKGWITRDEYLEHHHPDRWKVSKNGTPPVGARPVESDRVVASTAASSTSHDPSEE